ncbi:lytic transglycosylase domain-containing protein, partial [Salmonella enterica subsp. diarizonae]|nr:lytic transglycosylase domain-containing protein [Salmonella enterica subsp. diarizonae]
TSSHFSYLVPTVASPTTEETTLLWAEPQTPGGQ